MNFIQRRLSGLLPITCVLFSVVASTAQAGDHFLAIGGGDTPTNNQVSLEKNMFFFQRVLADTLGPSFVLDTLFSNGNAGTRDLQFEPSEDPPRVNVLLARLFGNEYDVNFHYRKHELTNLRGPSTRAGLDEWFNTTGKQLGESDRLFIYFTGHGGPGVPALNTTISMWCERPMQVTEFVGLLDRLNPKLQVVLVMVQCHSGGFASTIFKDAKVASGLSPARRCGFFATTYDRNAAGCTPDTREEDYKDYSTFFFAALDGKTRGGKPVTGCDLDGDGRISFSEAHAYAVVHSDTIDIPTTTSEALLRQYSKTGGVWMAKPGMAFDRLLARSSVTQKVMLSGLSEQLKLTADDRLAEVKHVADLIDAERKTIQKDVQQKRGEAEKLTKSIGRRTSQKWPEFSNPWNPATPELMAREGPQIQEAIEKDSDYARWDTLGRDINTLEERSFELERKWVKCQRMLRALDTAALAANLPKVALPEVVERYNQMVADEAGALTRGTGGPPVSPGVP